MELKFGEMGNVYWNEGDTWQTTNGGTKEKKKVSESDMMECLGINCISHPCRPCLAHLHENKIRFGNCKQAAAASL